MRLKYRLWALICGTFCLGIFAGLLLPPIWLVIVQGVLLLIVAICKLCG